MTPERIAQLRTKHQPTFFPSGGSSREINADDVNECLDEIERLDAQVSNLNLLILSLNDQLGSANTMFSKMQQRLPTQSQGG